MAYLGDYHTHTVYSHGKCSIEENVVRAIELGFKEIAITDHGFKHSIFHVRRMDFPDMEKEVAALRLKYPQINILLGIESNLNSHRGFIDLLPTEIKALDVVVCGYHFMVKPDRFKDFFKFWLPNFIQNLTKKTSKKMYIRNTDMYIKALNNYEIDILSHPNFGIEVDVVEVAKECKRHGTYFELNGRRISIDDKTLAKVAETGVEFIANSDAHKLKDIGSVGLVDKTIDRIGIPRSQLANWDRLPVWRSKKLQASLGHLEL